MSGKRISNRNPQDSESRREHLIKLGRGLLLLASGGLFGHLWQRRRCWNNDEITYSDQPCHYCSQLNGCSRPTAIVYLSDLEKSEKLDA